MIDEIHLNYTQMLENIYYKQFCKVWQVIASLK
jgi:hypothetical protein